MTRNKFRFLKLASVVVVGGALTAASVLTAGAQQAMGPGGRVISGKAQYGLHCAQCHGRGGKGDGPMSGALKTPPADLTVLAKNNGGTFPTDQVINTIRSNSPITAHQALAAQLRMSSESGLGGNFTPQQIQQKVKLIADYIQTLQVK
jgi:mono/diheme cytochrome c family protein